MNASDLRPKVLVADLVRPGDVVLTTTPEPISQVIRKTIGADISHAMICVGLSSVIDSTGDGVHARNLGRIILEPGCAAHVLRPVVPLTADQLRSVISFARAAIGTRYTMTGATKSVLAGFVAGRRQFCSRLVAQAYRSADVNLVSDADFCHPGELLESVALVEVPNVLRNLSAEEEIYWREDTDNVRAMRDSTNALLLEARKICSEVESLNDIDAYLVEHPEGDGHMVQALRSSRYLELWRDEFERSSWQYHVALMEGYSVSDEWKQWYCEALLVDESSSQNRFVVNHAGYVTLNTLHPRRYFAQMIELHDTLTFFHAKRIKAATSWLEFRGLVQPQPVELLRPHTTEWFASLRAWNPKQAVMTEAAIHAVGNSEVCSICGDDPAKDYALVTLPAAGPGTLRLCDDCFRIRSVDEPMSPF
jgi:hypothetical protein